MDPTASVAEDGSSEPLLSHKTPGSPSRRLNPDMVYHSTPPQEGTNEMHPVDELDEPIATFPFNTIVALRILIIILAIINVVIQFILRPYYFVRVVLVILTFVTLFWNVFAIGLRRLSIIVKRVWVKNRDHPESAGSGPTLPEVSCTVGNWKFSCFGDDEDDGPPKKHILSRVALVDAVLASLLMIFNLVMLGTYDWAGPGVLHIVTVVLLYVVAALQHFEIFGPVTVTVKSRVIGDDDIYKYRIQLPQDTRAGRAGKQPVSITA